MAVPVRATHQSRSVPEAWRVAGTAGGEGAMKFIHAADLHIDSPLVGLSCYEGAPAQRLREGTRGALENLVKLASDKTVDFVIIAGDLFADPAVKDDPVGEYPAPVPGMFNIGVLHTNVDGAMGAVGPGLRAHGRGHPTLRAGAPTGYAAGRGRASLPYDSRPLRPTIEPDYRSQDQRSVSGRLHRATRNCWGRKCKNLPLAKPRFILLKA